MSSLVFVVILAVWAVYLVQHWVRRRDHLATARSVDRFSEAMRVLERRRTLHVPEADVRPGSYAASPLRPARPARPDVVVKGAGTRAHGATAVAPSRDHRRSHRVAQLRAGGLLAGSLTMVILVGLAISGVAPRWSALAGVGVCAAAFALVRWSVAQQQAARRTPGASAPGRRAPARRAPARPAPAPRVSATGRTAPVGHRSAPRALPGAAPAPAAAPRHHPAAEHLPVAGRRPASATHPGHGHHELRGGRPSAEDHRRMHEGHEFSAQSVAATLRTTPRREPGSSAARDETGPAPYDLHAVEASLTGTNPGADHASATHHRATVRHELLPDGGGDAVAATPRPADGTWDPVPVPPPTYTLKAKAYRPPPTVSASLPADGTEMALEEEFEDLPRIDRVG